MRIVIAVGGNALLRWPGLGWAAHEPASIITLLAILLLGIGLDYEWKRARDRQASQPMVSS